VVKRCIAQGLFPARQVVPYAPWIIQRTALAWPAVHAAGQAVRLGRRQRRCPPGAPEWPDRAAPPGGAAPAAGRAETRSSQRLAGVP